MDYKLKRSLTGSQSIHLACPKCKEPVVFDLSDAGGVSPCPVCGVGIRVPGEAEKNAELERKREVKADARRREEAKRAEAEAQQAAEAKRREAASEASIAAAKRNFREESGAPGWLSSLKPLALILAGVGTICLFFAGNMDTSISTGSFDRVVNVGLLNTRLCLVIGGATSMLGCVVTSCASAIINQLAENARALNARLGAMAANVDARLR